MSEEFNNVDYNILKGNYPSIEDPLKMNDFSKHWEDIKKEIDESTIPQYIEDKIESEAIEAKKAELKEEKAKLQAKRNQDKAERQEILDTIPEQFKQDMMRIF